MLNQIMAALGIPRVESASKELGITRCRGALNNPGQYADAMAGLMADVVEDHVRAHLVDAERHPDALHE